MTAVSTSTAPSSEIRALTGLRGLAALYVVLFHGNGYYLFPLWIRPFIRHGYMAVDLFFILSGFVMAMTYADLFRNGFHFKNFKQFLLLRLARIYPLFLLMTVITAILIATVLSQTYDFDDLPRALIFNFTLTHVWGFCNSIVPPSWSISTEWLAYLLFPIAVYIAMHVPRRFSLLGLVVSFIVLWTIAYGPTWIAETAIFRRHGPLDIVSSYAIGTSLRCLASFYIGLVAFRFRNELPARAAFVLLAGAVILLCFRGSDIWLVGVFALLIMSLSHDEGLIAKWLGAPWAYFLGVISYALYLIHDLVQKIIFHSFPVWGIHTHQARLTWLIISIVVSIGLAALCHYKFEKPSRRVLRKFLIKTA